MVTGANRGIGFEVCRQLVESGNRVICSARTLSKAEDAAVKLGAFALELDVSNAVSVEAAAKRVKKEFSGLDVLINNAGIGIGSTGLARADLKNIRIIFETNFFGPMTVNTAFLPLLKRSQGSRIINISSEMGAWDDLDGNYAGYRLSKAGLNAQTIMLARELKSEGIAVVAICPGWVRTDMGGSVAPRSVKKGAEGIVWAAVTDKLQTGKFYRDGKVLSW